ncbi:Hypothetical predicted protein, partial [Paramuricea clavata]
MKSKLESTEENYKNVKKMLGETSKSEKSAIRPENVKDVDSCFRKETLKTETRSDDSRIQSQRQRKDLAQNCDWKAKISSDELSSASSSETQTRKAREVNENGRSETGILRRDRKTENSPVVIREENMDKASLQKWIRDTNRTIHDMQRCLVDVKGVLFGLPGKFENILKIHYGEGVKDLSETKQD